MSDDNGVADIAEAARLLHRAEDSTACQFCRAHVTATRLVVEDLLDVARLGDDLARHQRLRSATTYLGQVGEATGSLAVVARIIHFVKRFLR